jgi:NAD(P)-dependent dehydrogenase (short-subunit alcohol dehydrogenase family)
MRIKGSVAFVSGANRGFGLALARELLARGAAKVYAGMRRPQDLGIPGLVPVALDVTDDASVARAVAAAGDVTLLVNNAGIALFTPSMADASFVASARQMFETNYIGVIRLSRALAPILAANGGGAILNVLSVASWMARPALSAYAASKSAAWNFTNALRVELKQQGTLVSGLHVGFMDTDLTSGITSAKSDPAQIAALTLDGLEAGKEEILADAVTNAVKQSLSTATPIYLNPSAMA